MGNPLSLQTTSSQLYTRNLQNANNKEEYVKQHYIEEVEEGKQSALGNKSDNAQKNAAVENLIMDAQYSHELIKDANETLKGIEEAFKRIDPKKPEESSQILQNISNTITQLDEYIKTATTELKNDELKAVLQEFSNQCKNDISNTAVVSHEDTLNIIKNIEEIKTECKTQITNLLAQILVTNDKGNPKKELGDSYAPSPLEEQPHSGLQGSDDRGHDGYTPNSIFGSDDTIAELSQVPYSILALQVATGTMQVMSMQSELALKKVQAMESLIESLQALVTLLTALQNKLNDTFADEANNSSKSGNPDTDNHLKYGDVAGRFHGTGVDQKIYDFSAYNGKYDAARKNNPIVQALLKIGVAHVANGKLTVDTFDYNSLPESKKAILNNAMASYKQMEANDPDHKRKDMIYKDPKITDNSSSKKYWDASGKPAIGKGDGDDPKYDGTVIFDKSQLPPELISLLDAGGYGLKSKANGPVDCYAVNLNVLNQYAGKLVQQYSNAMGESRDDFSQQTVEDGISGTTKDVANLTSVVNQMLTYIQKQIETQAQKAQQCNDKQNYTSQQFERIVNATQARTGG